MTQNPNLPQQDIIDMDGNTDAELARLYQEIATGEKTADALELSLTGLEAKIDAILTAADQRERQQQSPSYHNPHAHAHAQAQAYHQHSQK